MKRLNLHRSAILVSLCFFGYPISCYAACDDSGNTVCSVENVDQLIRAIDKANEDDILDKITLHPGNYPMEEPNFYQTIYGNSSLPQIRTSITIQGAGSEKVMLSGSGIIRAIIVEPNGSLTLEKLTVTGFNDGGISNHGQLSIIQSSFTNNRTQSNGGAIINFGLLNIHNSKIVDNTANTGGGIHNSGKVNIFNTMIENNTLIDGDGPGGGINNWGGEATIVNSTVKGNTIGGYGTGRGGGLANFGSMLVLGTSITGNYQAGGGGVFNASNLTLKNSTINENDAIGGGGIYNEGTVTLENTTLSGNRAVLGGGIYDSVTAITVLENTTITNNSVSYHPNPYYNFASGGGIENDGALKAKNSIISNNIGGNCGAIVTSEGNNLDSDGTCQLNGANDISLLDPLLGPLQDNGGLTKTHALLANSPAIDSGDNDTCPPRDQRGAIRPKNTSDPCDIGAYEVGVLTTLDQVQVNGDANKEQSFLRLTPDEPSKTGSAFIPTSFTLTPNSVIHTRFAFEIGGANLDGPLGSDGFAFVIHNDPRGASAIGNGGEGLGFGVNDTGGNPLSTISPSLAVEFDTHLNSFPEHSSGDPDGNHVAVIKNGEVFNHLAYDASALSLNDGSPRYVWIDYVGVTKQMDVFMSTTDVKPVAPIISTTVDLAAAVGNNAYFGFTAGTGGGFNSHDILAWKLDVVSSPAVGDFNGDSCIDRTDLSIVMAGITGSGVQSLVYDLNGDGKVNIADSRKLVTLFTNPRGVACN